MSRRVCGPTDGRGCTFSASEDYGIRMGTHSHWCSSGENTLVIWSAA